MSDPCPCVARHVPAIAEFDCDDHHSPPKSWPLAPGATRVLHHLCATTHRRCHDLLNRYVAAGGEPGWVVLRHYSPLVRRIAQESWMHTDHSGAPLPRTLA